MTLLLGYRGSDGVFVAADRRVHVAGGMDLQPDQIKVGKLGGAVVAMGGTAQIANDVRMGLALARTDYMAPEHFAAVAFAAYMRWQKVVPNLDLSLTAILAWPARLTLVCCGRFGVEYQEVAEGERVAATVGLPNDLDGAEVANFLYQLHRREGRVHVAQWALHAAEFLAAQAPHAVGLPLDVFLILPTGSQSATLGQMAELVDWTLADI